MTQKKEIVFDRSGKVSCLLPEGRGERGIPAGVAGFWEGESSRAGSGTGAQQSAVCGAVPGLCPTSLHGPWLTHGGVQGP